MYARLSRTFEILRSQRYIKKWSISDRVKGYLGDKTVGVLVMQIVYCNGGGKWDIQRISFSDMYIIIYIIYQIFCNNYLKDAAPYL